MKQNFIGIDVGGTNIRIGATDESGVLRFSHSEPVLANVNSPDNFLEKLIRLVKSIPGWETGKGIGIGIPGMVSGEEITTCRNIPMLKGYPLATKLKKQLGLPVFIQNDAKLAAFGETLAGAGADGNIVCYVGLGTGVGGGVVMDKKIYLGSSNLGGYFSRIILDGENLCEHLVSGTGLLAQAKKKIEPLESITDFLDLVKQKDPAATEVFNQFKKNLVNLLLCLSVTINPDTIVLGGGLMKSHRLFFDEVVTQFMEKAHSAAVDTKINLAILEEPGVVGAALFAADNTNQRKNNGK